MPTRLYSHVKDPEQLKQSKTGLGVPELNTNAAGNHLERCKVFKPNPLCAKYGYLVFLVNSYSFDMLS